MNLDNANETDVREVIVRPFLHELGYALGTENDILTERRLSYDKIVLGRKKKNDPPLAGRADYILSVTGYARWIIEVKGPSESIDESSIFQALSYARHPEVSGCYAAITNGRRFVLYRMTQDHKEAPLIDVEVIEPKALAFEVRGVLSPPAIRRDFKPIAIDLGQPLADGLRSKAKIDKGIIKYTWCDWESNILMPPPAKAHMDGAIQLMKNQHTNVVGGDVWRDDYGHIHAVLEYAQFNDQFMAMMRKGFREEFVSASSVVSTDKDNQTSFDIMGSMRIEKGDAVYDVTRWTTTQAMFQTNSTTRGTAKGYLDVLSFKGEFQTEIVIEFSVLPGAVVTIFGAGEFDLIIDQR